ncbi:polysaccharide deacetylase family protein [Pseudoalteromonas piscicida]|uniref:polysaccharide deacetylase family protein n=1 Tax=Pseudoalteromonas piscicida TaxID=43662 RepID=UPI0005FA450E|nr:polysaccharide deacetylase family protein [Pseudoalteromonas piscicida]KJZ04886.1 polysaccharide deacetylase [Pseudoalteromonas piscicida]
MAKLSSNLVSHFSLAAMMASALLVNTSSIAADNKQTFSYPNNARNAISLTFDDARPSQVDVGVPLLNRHKVKGTFYVMPPQVKEKLGLWQAAVKQGHEIGNHTSEHLCTGNFAWLREKDKGLEQVDLAYIERDVVSTTKYIEKHLGVTPRSFAYPCGNTFVGRGAEVKSYVPVIAKYFDSGRTWLDETANHPTYTDFAQLTGVRMDGVSFEELKGLLEHLRANNSWIILAGHEVGEKGMYTVDTKMLDQLIPYLQDPKNGYWLDTVSNVGDYIKSKREP